MPFQADRVTIGLKQERLWLDGAALQFGFDRVKDDLGWYHRKILQRMMAARARIR